MFCIGGYFGFQIQTIYYNNMFVAKDNKKNISVSYGTFCILNPLIFNQEIGRGYDIPWVGGGSIYYG